MTRAKAKENMRTVLDNYKKERYTGTYNLTSLIDKIFDHFEQKEAELRAEFQKKISEINLEHDSKVETWQDRVDNCSKEIIEVLKKYKCELYVENDYNDNIVVRDHETQNDYEDLMIERKQ